ncbi:hypothetical protein LguiB_028297 [Lonicera macranthoides]
MVKTFQSVKIDVDNVFKDNHSHGYGSGDRKMLPAPVVENSGKLEQRRKSKRGDENEKKDWYTIAFFV